MADEAESTRVSGGSSGGRMPSVHLRWRHVVAATVVAVMLASAYAVTVTLYVGAQQPASTHFAKNAGVHRLLTATVSIVSIDPATNDLTISVDVLPSGTVAAPDGIKVARPVRLEVLGSRGPQDESVDAGGQITPLAVEIGMNGSQSSYPFDTYRAPLDVSVIAPPTSKTQPGVVPTFIFNGAFSGYRVKADAIPRQAGNRQLLGVVLTVTRASVTIVFAVLMLVLQGLLAAAAAAAAFMVFRQRWRAETSVLTWLAAMLFAIVPLRQAMPGAPPIGVEIDVLVFLWAVAIIVFSLVGVFVVWARRAPPVRAE
jgi:hypothetical protein